MVEKGPAGLSGDPAQPMGQPFGFASPLAPPLSALASPPAPAEAQVSPAPDSYAPPHAPPLESIAPARTEVRDPAEPFAGTFPQAADSNWQPDQPLQLNSATAASPEVDLSALPPPSGPAVVALPTHPPAIPVPVPVQYPMNPYPVNPYATGPYSAPTGPGGWAPPQRNQPITPAMVWEASNSFVLILLAVGAFVPQASAYALIAAAMVSVARSSPGRVLVGVAALISVLIWWVWWLGYFATSQWQDATQLLCTVCLIGVPLLAYQSLRRTPQS